MGRKKKKKKKKKIGTDDDLSLSTLYFVTKEKYVIYKKWTGEHNLKKKKLLFVVVL